MHTINLPSNHPLLLLGLLMLVVMIIPPLLQRIKIPGIIGIILSGFFLGPHGLNVLVQGEGIGLISKAGLIYLMFWAGLEIDLAAFNRNKHKSLIFGLLTFALPLTVGGFCAYQFLGFSLMEAILLASMFSTHTLVSYPIVNRYQIARQEVVAIAVGGTIITDTLALLVLAIVSGLAQEDTGRWFWLMLALKFSVFGLFIYYVVPKIATWFFQKVESDLTYQYVFVLTILFSCSILAEVSGIESIIGAFFAGLVLNRSIPHSSPLMDRIGLIGDSLFIPAFLFSVGMVVNLNAFFSSTESIILAIVLSIIALVTKWIAAMVNQYLFSYSKEEGWLVFGLTSSHAAATIAIVLVGVQLHLFDEKVLNAVIFLILVTCLTSGFVTEKATRRLAALIKSMISPSLSQQKILVPFSNPATVDGLIHFARVLKTNHNQEPISPLTVILDGDQVTEKINQSRQLLKPVIVEMEKKGILLSPIHRIDVNATSGILRACKELSATDIVVGWKPETSKIEKFFGGILQNLLEMSGEFVFVIHIPHDLLKFNKVVMVLPGQNRRLETLAPRVENICHKLNIPLLMCAEASTMANIQNNFSRNFFVETDVLESSPRELFQIHKKLSRESLIILVGARKEDLAYDHYVEKFPKYLSDHFADNGFVLVFPPI